MTLQGWREDMGAFAVPEPCDRLLNLNIESASVWPLAGWIRGRVRVTALCHAPCTSYWLAGAPCRTVCVIRSISDMGSRFLLYAAYSYQGSCREREGYPVLA